ncbi:unnamed protein product [Ranitomeya imitator]|uniref:PRA1 family protein n=1 Tax=Ranitomeya imitator TaxID=111125 RepID=A0ABN9KSJ7_9NEOB|nr:unnamed protein product [Ranitomeya imitator]
MDVLVAPLRAWDDFFPGSDRFSRPDFQDISRWNNRVISNLLYYQTNYLALAAAVVCLVSQSSQHAPGRQHRGPGLLGFVWTSHNKDAVRKFKKQYPTLFIMSIMLSSYFVISMFGGVMVFMFGITFPLLLMFVHASLRLRNIKNKVENKFENIGLKKTPMGIVLDALEQEEDNFAKIAAVINKMKKVEE